MSTPSVPIKHLAEIPVVAGLNLPAEDGHPEWPRYIRTTDIDGLFRLIANAERISPDLVGECTVKRGDLLFSRTGSLGTVYAHRSDEAAAFAGYLVRVRPDRRRSSPEFLAYWASSAQCQQQIAAGAIRSTIDNFSAKKVANLLVPALRLEKQRAIAGFLDRECARIDSLMDSLAELDASARSGVVERLRALVLGPGWPLAPVKYYARTGTGHTPSRNRDDYWIPEECVVPWFTLADVNQIRDGRRWEVSETAERISEIGIANSSAQKHPARTVVLSRTASVGFSAVLQREMAVSQDFMTWTCGPDLDPFYLLVALRAMQPELRRLMYGSTHKTIYMPDLHALRIPLPPLDTQREIVATARDDGGALWPLSDELGAMIGELSEYRDAIITEAVTGQLDVVKLADSETAESLAAVREIESPEVLAR